MHKAANVIGDQELGNGGFAGGEKRNPDVFFINVHHGEL